MAEKEQQRGKASLIVINEAGEALQLFTNECSNGEIAFLLGEAGILTKDAAKHLNAD